MAKKTIADAIVEAHLTGEIPEALSGFTLGETIPSGETQANIANAEIAHDMTGADTVDQAGLEAALDALGTKVNSILAVLEEFKLTAAS